MTTAETQQAEPGRAGQAWRNFRRWRRTRPYWGGLFTALAGLEIFGSTQMSLHGLTFQMGPTGFLSWLIPVILFTCGMLLWFSPQQRMFYAVVAAITALYSMIGVNLGGFFIGLLLGMVGSALGFAWVPQKQPAAEPAEPVEPVEEDDATGEPEPALVDELLPRQREDETTGVDFTQHAETAYAEGVHGHVASRRPSAFPSAHGAPPAPEITDDKDPQQR